MEISIQWIQENPLILFLIVVIVFLVIMIYGGSDRSQDMMERFLETLSGLLEAAGEALTSNPLFHTLDPFGMGFPFCRILYNEQSFCISAAF